MTEEEWRPIKGYEGLYEVSSFGRVKSLDRYVKGRYGNYRLQKGKLLNPGLSSNGYLQVDLCLNGKVKKYSVHRLVAQTFIPNSDGLPQINHKDEDKINNRVDNLEWCDSKYNLSYGTARIRSKKTRIKNGSWTGLSEKEYRRKYWEDHRDHLIEWRRKYRENHRDHINELSREYKRKRKAGL